MNGLRNNTVQLIIGVAASVIAAFLSKFLSNSDVVFGLVVAEAVILLAVYIIYLTNKTPNPSAFENTSTSKTRYSIVIVDDEFGNRRTRINESFRKYFDGLDIQLLKSVNDARQLEAYDVVILDILNANEMRGDTHGIFDDIHRLYPEKYVIAMSQNSSECMSLCEKEHKANSSLPKPITKEGALDIEKWKSDIQDKINQAFSELDSPKSYWNTVEKKVQTGKEQNLARDRYVSFLQKHSNFKKSGFFSRK